MTEEKNARPRRRVGHALMSYRALAACCAGTMLLGAAAIIADALGARVTVFSEYCWAGMVIFWSLVTLVYGKLHIDARDEANQLWVANERLGDLLSLHSRLWTCHFCRFAATNPVDVLAHEIVEHNA